MYIPIPLLFCVKYRDLRDQFLRFKTETETEQVKSQQARLRPRLKRYSLNKRDRDSCSRIFETETETRKISIFETKTRKIFIFETETRKIVETESLADLWFIAAIEIIVIQVNQLAGCRIMGHF